MRSSMQGVTTVSSWAHCLERTALPVEAAEVPGDGGGGRRWGCGGGGGLGGGARVRRRRWRRGEAEAEAAVEGGAEVAGAPEGGAEVGAGWAVEAAVEPGLKAREAATVNGRPDRSPQNNARPKGGRTKARSGIRDEARPTLTKVRMAKKAARFLKVFIRAIDSLPTKGAQALAPVMPTRYRFRNKKARPDFSAPRFFSGEQPALPAAPTARTLGLGFPCFRRAGNPPRRGRTPLPSS